MYHARTEATAFSCILNGPRQASTSLNCAFPDAHTAPSLTVTSGGPPHRLDLVIPWRVFCLYTSLNLQNCQLSSRALNNTVKDSATDLEAEPDRPRKLSYTTVSLGLPAFERYTTNYPQ